LIPAGAYEETDLRELLNLVGPRGEILRRPWRNARLARRASRDGLTPPAAAGGRNGRRRRGSRCRPAVISPCSMKYRSAACSGRCASRSYSGLSEDASGRRAVGLRYCPAPTCSRRTIGHRQVDGRSLRVFSGQHLPASTQGTSAAGTQKHGPGRRTRSRPRPKHRPWAAARLMAAVRCWQPICIRSDSALRAKPCAAAQSFQRATPLHPMLVAFPGGIHGSGPSPADVVGREPAEWQSVLDDRGLPECGRPSITGLIRRCAGIHRLHMWSYTAGQASAKKAGDAAYGPFNLTGPGPRLRRRAGRFP